MVLKKFIVAIASACSALATQACVAHAATSNGYIVNGTIDGQRVIWTQSDEEAAEARFHDMCRQLYGSPYNNGLIQAGDTGTSGTSSTPQGITGGPPNNYAVQIGTGVQQNNDFIQDYSESTGNSKDTYLVLEAHSHHTVVRLAHTTF